MKESSADEIASWTNQRTQEKHDLLGRQETSAQGKNQGWWEAFPMTYQSWDKSERIPKTAADFANLDRLYFESNPYIEQHVDFSSFNGKRVLEIGCGGGSAACRFARHGALVTAVDITESAVKLTRSNAEVQGVSVDVKQMDAESLAELPDNTFDFVYSWGVLHHTSSPPTAYRQVTRVLNEGGGWLVMVYHRNSLRYWGKGLWHLLLKGGLLRGETMDSAQRFFTDGYYHQHYTRAQFRTILQQCGLKVSDVDVTHMSSRMIPAIPESVRTALKQRIGWLLVAEGQRQSTLQDQ